MTAEVSVVMSVFNGAEHLDQSIESILVQDVDLELVLVDDGSTDTSFEIASGYATRDHRVRLLRQENQGLTKALVRGCADARGRFIARQDVGDISLPGRLRAQRDLLASDAALSFVSCWTAHCGPALELLYVARGSGNARHAVNILCESCEHGVIDGPTSHPSVMFRSDAYHAAGGYRDAFYYGQDWDLWYRLAAVGKFQMVERVLYHVRVEPGSISALHGDRQRELGQLSLEGMRRRLKGEAESDVLDRARRIRPTASAKQPGSDADWLYFIGECLRSNGDARARRYLMKAIRRRPTFAKAWVRLAQSAFLRHAPL
jgi:glycosyltransferase involved in cell wall biosynthesis